MLALFEDLKHNIKSPRINFSLRRRRRCTPFVITFKNVSSGNSAARRFLQTFGELIDQSKGTALLLLASVNGKAPDSLQADTDTFNTAAEKLQLIRRGRYESSTITAFNIQATAPPEQAEQIRLYVTNRPTPKPRFTRGDFALPIFVGALTLPFITLATLAGLIFFVRAVPQLYQSTQHCKYMRSTHDRGSPPEIIGITDGSCSFLTEPDRRANGYAETTNSLLRKIYIARGFTADTLAYIGSLGQNKHHPLTAERQDYIRELNSAKQIIFSQNQSLKKEAPNSYSTIVLLIPFTAPDESGHINQKTIGILRGVAVAQQEINRKADHAPAKSPQHLKLKVLIANTGDQLVHGAEVAKNIRDLNSKGGAPLGAKHSIVAVVGITQSLDKARKTVDPLTGGDSTSNPAIPVVGSTLTYDYMSGSDPLFYQASAPNRRQAQVLAEFIRNQPIVVSGNAQQPLKAASNLVIINDENDWYSQNLADDLYGEFKNKTPPTADCPVLASWSVKITEPNEDEKTYPAVTHKPAPCNQAANPKTDPFVKYNKPVTASLTHIQSELCDPDNLPTFDQQNDIIVYTGRSSHFSTFLNALKPDVCSRGRGFTIVAGSDMAQWGEYDTYKGFFPHLYFGAYGAQGSPDNGTIADSFFANPIVKDIVDQSGGARAYDSVKMLWPIVAQAAIEHPSPGVGQVTTLMFKKSLSDWPRIQSEGASGVIDIPKGQRVPINRPVFVMRAGSDQPAMSCGIFSIGSADRLNAHGRPFSETKWGKDKQFDCPVEREPLPLPMGR
jgi:hypothetical protein